MRLAWRNLLHDRTRFAVTVVGIAFAVFLMILQGSLLSGFLRAASVFVDATDADLWIAARGVPAFDFPAPVPARFRSLALGVEGVVGVDRVASGIALWQRPDGVRETVIIVGTDPGVGRRFRRLAPGGSGADPDAVAADGSTLEQLGVRSFPTDVEIGGRRARVVGATTGFASFLSTPYVFTSFADGARYVGLGPEETTFLLCRVAPGADVAVVKAALEARLPRVDVWTREEFAARSRTYFAAKTGAGGSLLMSGLLGFIIGVVIVSQTTYATTMEHIEEFATLKAMGAPNRYVRRLVLVQALAGGFVGYVTALAASVPALALVRGTIAWAHTPWWLPPAMLAVSAAMCGAASLVAIRAALTVEPGRVFRA